MGALHADWMACMTGAYPVHEPDVESRLDALLAAWYAWRREKDARAVSRGFGSTDGTCRDYRAPGHCDWWNGAADARADDLVMRGMDDAMDKVPNEPRRWNTALHFEAMNLHSGAAVWRSPMLPADRHELDVLVREARNRLLQQLMKAGVMG